MKVLMIIRFPHHSFNTAVRDGSAGAKIDAILAETNPEAVYFTELEGRRTAIAVVDLKDSSKIPTLAEPWFLTFNADVEFHPAMSPKDLKKSGLDKLGKKWG